MPPDTNAVPTHVLVADDDPTSLSFFARLLKLSGYRVTTVQDGQQAHDRLQQGDIDVVLSDIGMPGLNGIQLLQAMGSSDKDPPVVLVTGNPQLETAVQALHGRAVAYLNKPVDSAMLLDSIGRAVQISHLAKARRTLQQVVAPPAEDSTEEAQRRRSLANAQRTLWMAFQPIVSLAQGKVFAYEALVRNEDPQLGNPGALLHAAQAEGKLRDLGRQIRNTIAGEFSAVPPDTLIFVNLIPQDLLDDNLYDKTAPLTAHAHRVVLEITERDSLDDIDTLAQRLQDLRSLGFRLALDDLGAGYSGLTSFLALRPDVVKLDMSLVRNIHENAEQRLLVESIARTMIHDFRTLVVAEGVEKLAERDTLRSMQIDLLQGFVFGRPRRHFIPVDPSTLAPQ